MKKAILLSIGTALFFGGVFIQQGIDGVSVGMILYGIVMIVIAGFHSIPNWID